MSKILKKVIKTGSGHLAPTESIEAVLGVATSGQIVAHSVGGIAGMVVNKKLQAKRAAADGDGTQRLYGGSPALRCRRRNGVTPTPRRNQSPGRLQTR